MKIFVASDSYKGCMSSAVANEVIKKAILEVDSKHEVSTFSVADGGEGTSEAFRDACGGSLVTCIVKDAYFHNVEAQYTFMNDGVTAVIEVASCIALNAYQREKRKPMYATSYGVGQLLLDAKKKGAKKIILGLGGSATNDGGMGLLQALGVKFFDENNHYLKSNATNLQSIKRIDMSKLEQFKGIEMIAACDVENKLLGELGATKVFGKQKGLYPNQIKNIEKGMQNYTDIFKVQGVVLDDIIGGGAAGGIGAVVQALFHAKQCNGLDLLIQHTDVEKEIKTCDLVITGEGQSDKQTLYGKTPVGILKLANKHNIPCVCISGALGVEYKRLYEIGFIGIFSIADRAMSFADALRLAPEKLHNATYNIVKTIQYFKEM